MQDYIFINDINNSKYRGYLSLSPLILLIRAALILDIPFLVILLVSVVIFFIDRNIFWLSRNETWIEF